MRSSASPGRNAPSAVEIEALHRLLDGDDLAIVSPRVKAEGLRKDVSGPSCVQLDEDGDCLLLRVDKEDLTRLKTDSLDALVELPGVGRKTANVVLG